MLAAVSGVHNIVQKADILVSGISGWTNSIRMLTHIYVEWKMLHISLNIGYTIVIRRASNQWSQEQQQFYHHKNNPYRYWCILKLSCSARCVECLTMYRTAMLIIFLPQVISKRVLGYLDLVIKPAPL